LKILNELIPLCTSESFKRYLPNTTLTPSDDVAKWSGEDLAKARRNAESIISGVWNSDYKVNDKSKEMLRLVSRCIPQVN
jgi:hypothetical protein